jgi:hypothetical protein
VVEPATHSNTNGHVSSETTVARTVESDPVEPPSPTACVWAQSALNAPVRKPSTLQFGDEQYYEIGSGKPCDTVTVYIDTAEQLGQGLAAFDATSERLGAENVRLEIGTGALVYTSRDEVLADADAGPAALAAIPKEFDFATMALARYNVLHSRQVRCRDGMLRLTGKQVEAMRRSDEKWHKRRQQLASEWLYVAGATELVRDVHVLDPVLPAERAALPNGPCNETWITQPALTEVPHGAIVRLITR